MTNERQLTHLDLFSGIGGFALAAHWAGFRTVAFCENDPWCQGILRRHWPGVPIHGDVRVFPGTDYRGVTLLTGGFPCQPFSQTGKRRGKDDDRWLWPEMFEVIKSARPSWVLCENVPGVIKMALQTIVADLEAAGYESTVLLVPAIGVGAPHRRRRAWIVAKSLDTDADGVRPHREEVHEEGQGGGPELRHEQERLPGPMVPEQVWARIDPRVLGVVNGVPDRVDRASRLRGLGNAVVPQVVCEILMAIRATMLSVGDRGTARLRPSDSPS